MWLKLALLSAVSKALNQVTTKVLLKYAGVLEISAYGQLASAFIIIPAIFLTSRIQVPASGEFHTAAWITIILNVVAIVLLVEAIRRSDLSRAVPFLSLTPVFAILSAWMIRGEQLGPGGISGIAFVTIGALGIDATSVRDWISLGGRRVLHDKGVWLILIVALIYAVSSVYDKTATLLSDPLTFVWYSAIWRAALLTLILVLWRTFSPRSKSKRFIVRKERIILICGFAALGITFLLEAIFQMFALQTGFVAFVLAIKRLSIIMTSIIGFMLFRERFTWFRLGGMITMVAGSAIIYLYT
jgi:drug/metabolite transporter (DMT)-like permease